MEARPLDRIHIRDLLLRCIIGIREWERHELQNVYIQITLHADFTDASGTDSIADTVDYVTLKRRIIALVEGSSFHLIETLAERVAGVCLEDRRVRRVDVTIEKPGALSFARSVAVEITRFQPGDAPSPPRP